MNWRGLYLGIFWMWAAVAPWFGFGQTAGAAHAVAGVDDAGNAQTVEAALHLMSRRAAVLFVGRVAEIRRKEGSGAGSGVVEIRFDVEQAIRGCAGGTYTLREWAGLWSANDSRYRVGQRLLMMLHAPGATGLSSPVGGMDGAIPLRASGGGVRAGEASSDAAEAVADLRWIGAKVVRTVSYRAPSAGVRVVAHAAGAPVAMPAQGAVGAGWSTEGAGKASTPAQEASLSSVVGMMRSWGGADATR
ncbi:MAG: hypothetical protein NVSMB3_03380 [Acidobacteriaceae bacterium]